MIMLAKAINNKDQRFDWLPYKNIKDWNQKAKECIISIEMGTLEQGLIRKSFVCLLLYQTDEFTLVILFNCLF